MVYNFEDNRAAAGTREQDCKNGPSLKPQAPPIWLRLDPRANWLLYLLLVIASMLQHEWIGLAATAVPVAAGFIGVPRSVMRGGVKILKPFIWFAAFSVVLSGIQLSVADSYPDIGFSVDRALVTAMNVTRLLIVTAASYWFATTTPYRAMVQGLQWSLQAGTKLKLPVESFTLAVSLMFRFLPLILREWQRFSVIVRARGKASLRPGAIRARDIPALVVPVLLSLFYRAEEMTMAIEMKNTGIRSSRSAKDTLHWTRADSIMVGAAAVVFGLLVAVR